MGNILSSTRYSGAIGWWRNEESETATVDSLTENLSNNPVMSIKDNTCDVNGIKQSVNMSDNTLDMSENTPEMSENTPYMSENTPDISENTSEMGENTPYTSMSENTPDISENTSEMGENTPYTSENTPDISENTPCTSENTSDISEPRVLSPAKIKELEEFREQLAIKRRDRIKIIAKKSNEMQSLRDALENEKRMHEEALAENSRLRELLLINNIDVANANASQEEAVEDENNQSTLAVVELENEVALLKEQSKRFRLELAECNCSLQSANKEITLFNKENFELKNQIKALKDVSKVSKEMLSIREVQLSQLKEKLSEIEQSLADREMRTMSNELKSEYERQLENIRNLRSLYEERARLAEVTRVNLLREVDNQKIITESQVRKISELELRVEELEKELSEKIDMLFAKDSQLGLSKAETRGLRAEMAVINQLFSQMLLGNNSGQDLDKLLVKLEENHDLLADMVVREDCSETASALPKLILDLVNQMDVAESRLDGTEGEVSEEATETEDPSTSKALTSAKEIVGNLPKVWRVLMELLSHQTGPPLIVSEISEKSASNCYKSVDTPAGPIMVPSVSKTYIRLKDLILEKKSLQKEMTRLKTLNTHLESRLQDQERRLGLVSSELGKTWHVVGKMQRQHQQIHTHEKILRYELQQKRILLTHLKEELEFCKEKWDKAKQKNSESQIEWDKLREEFARRKIKSLDSVNNSAESGYSDERASDDDSDEGGISERIRLKRKGKSPEANLLGETIKSVLTQAHIGDDENIDSDALQDDEELQNEGNGILSDGDSQANLADNEDQSISEATPKDASDNERETVVEDIEFLRSSSSTPSTSRQSYKDVRTPKTERLKKLEEQCYVLVNKVTKTTSKGVELCQRLEELHNQYGNERTEETTVSPVNNISNDEIDTAINSNNPDISVQNYEVDLNRPESSSCQTELKDIVNELVSNEKSEGDALSSSENDEQVSETPNISISNNLSEYEARFAAREKRLKKMEEQAKSLVKKVSNTSTRSVEINFKLDELHNVYGRVEDENNREEENRVEQDNLNDTDTSETTGLKDATHGGTSEEIENVSTIDLCLDNKTKSDTEEELNLDEQIKPLNNENDTFNKCIEINSKSDEQLETNGRPDEEIKDINNKLDESIEIYERACGSSSCISDQNEDVLDSSKTVKTDYVSEYEARFAAREERLKRMEEQAKSLVKKAVNTSTRNVEINSKLDELHSTYGRSEEQNEMGESSNVELESADLQISNGTDEE